MQFLEIIKKHKVLLVIVLIAIAGIDLFFARMYHNDVKALEDFTASYQNFDKTISEFSIGNSNDLKNQAGDAVTELKAKANFRISSLIKNDSKLPSQAALVAELAKQELDSLSAFKLTLQHKSLESRVLSQQYSDLSKKRKAAYAEFQELAK